MDLLKKKFTKKQKKQKKPKALKKKVSKTSNRRKPKKEKASQQKKEEQDSGSDSESRKNIASQKEKDAEAVDKKYNMRGKLLKMPKDPQDFHLKLLQSECMEMMNSNITSEECKILDDYMKKKAELRSSDHVVINETINREDEKKSDRLKIMTKYDEGRFGAIYIVQSESAVDDNVVSSSSGCLVMKTALRNVSSNTLVFRLNKEIKVIQMLFSIKDDLPKRIAPILYEGRVLGVPFFVTSLLDANLEKCKEEMGGFFSIPSAFYIAQEILMTLKFIHRRGFVHRDIKPTNILVNTMNQNQFFLIDFGETILADKQAPLSPPDGLTLPFISRAAHDVVESKGINKVAMDIESWFYVFMDILKPLPWRDNNDMDAVKTAKCKFWDDLEGQMSPKDYPAQAIQLAKLVKSGKCDPPYTEYSKILSDAFFALKDAGWAPDWIDRNATKIKNRQRASTENEKRSKESKESAENVAATVTVGSAEAQNNAENHNNNSKKKKRNAVAVVVGSASLAGEFASKEVLAVPQGAAATPSDKKPNKTTLAKVWAPEEEVLPAVKKSVSREGGMTPPPNRENSMYVDIKMMTTANRCQPVAGRKYKYRGKK